MKVLSIAFVVLGACGSLSAEAPPALTSFPLRDVSSSFDVMVEFELDAEGDHVEGGCSEHSCSGPATIRLLRKNEETPFQTLQIPLFLHGASDSGVVFDDFDFDGLEDLALHNGNNGNYGGPSYDILLFSNAEQRFVKHAELTNLASSNLGLFAVDEKLEQLETSSKSGCCWHQAVRYEMHEGKPLKVRVVTEQVRRNDDHQEQALVTTEELVDGTWRKSEKTMTLAEYQGTSSDKANQEPPVEKTPVRRSFLLNRASNAFDVSVDLEIGDGAESDTGFCNDATCVGAATIKLSRKNETTSFQTVNMRLYLELDGSGNPTVNGVVFDDFDFDDFEDLALRNAEPYHYGGPFYDVFLFSEADQRFIKHQELTDLASKEGLFTVDEEKKQLEVSSRRASPGKSTVRYEMRDGHLLKVRVVTAGFRRKADQALEWVETTEVLVDGVWQTTEKVSPSSPR